MRTNGKQEFFRCQIDLIASLYKIGQSRHTCRSRICRQNVNGRVRDHQRRDDVRCLLPTPYMSNNKAMYGIFGKMALLFTTKLIPSTDRRDIPNLGTCYPLPMLFNHFKRGRLMLLKQSERQNNLASSKIQTV